MIKFTKLAWAIKLLVSGQKKAESCAKLSGHFFEISGGLRC